MSSERRTYPRYSIHTDVLVSMPGPAESTSDFTVESINVSLAGIQLSCNGDLITALLEQPKLPFGCTVHFNLPSNEHRFVLGSQYLSYRRKSQRDFVMVVIFLHEDEQQKQLLEALLTGMM
ncbi:MAG: PilZ domain-containing protein [Pseudomonadota bacterium]